LVRAENTMTSAEDPQLAGPLSGSSGEGQAEGHAPLGRAGEGRCPGRGRSRRAALLILLFAAGGALAGWMLRPPLYRAEAIVQFVPTLPSAPGAAGENAAVMFTGFVSLQVALLESQMMATRAMATEGWKRVGGSTPHESVDEFVRSRILLHAAGEPYVRVRFLDPDPAVALGGVRALLDAYSEHVSRESEEDDQLKFASARAEDLSTRLREVSDGSLKLVDEYGGAEGLDIRHRAMVEQVLQIEQELARIRQRIHENESGAGNPSPQAPSPPQSTPVSPEAPADLRSRESAIQDRLKLVRSESVRLGKVRVEYAGRQSEAEELRRQRDRVLELRAQLEAQLVGKARIRIVDSGTLPASPFQDPRPMASALGGALGMALGALAAALVGRRGRAAVMEAQSTPRVDRA
jgi:hypothetical protein